MQTYDSAPPRIGKVRAEKCATKPKKAPKKGGFIAKAMRRKQGK